MNEKTMDETTVIERCREGDRQAFRLLVEDYRGMVFALALRLLADEQAAKDIAQETFIRVWLNIRKFDTGKSLRAWIYTIAVRLCLDQLEKAARKGATGGDTETLERFATSAPPDHRLENKELAEVIRSLTERLSARQRTVFTLVYLENLTIKEVEEATGLGANTIKSNLYLARKAIKEQLKRMGYE